MPKKIAYNNCYGGFSLSNAAIVLGQQLSGNPEWGKSGEQDIPRDDTTLVQVIEQLGAVANGAAAELRITTVSGKWKIDAYDGYEVVVEPDDIVWNE